MKIKTNIRAGQGSNSNSNSASGGHSGQAAGTVGFYLPPTTRCVGI